MSYKTKELKDKFGLGKGVSVRGLVSASLLRFKLGVETEPIAKIKNIKFNEEEDCYEVYVDNLAEIAEIALPEDVDIEDLKPEETFFPIHEDDLGKLRPLGIDKLPEEFDIENGMIDSEEYTIPMEVIRSLIPFYEAMSKKQEEFEEFIDYENLGIKLDEDTFVSFKELGVLINSSDLDI